MSDRTANAFFYGLFMDEAVLQGSGVVPREPRKAVVSGYRLQLGQRAKMVHQFGALDPDRAVPITIAIEPVRIDAAIHFILHFEHGRDFSDHQLRDGLLYQWHHVVPVSYRFACGRCAVLPARVRALYDTNGRKHS